MIIIIFENCVFEMWTAIRSQIQIQMCNSSCGCVSKTTANCNVYVCCLWANAVRGGLKHVLSAGRRRRRRKLGRIGQAYSPFLSKLSFKRASKCWLSAFNLNVNAWRLNWANKFSARHPHPPSAAVSLCLSLSLSLFSWSLLIPK